MERGQKIYFSVFNFSFTCNVLSEISLIGDIKKFKRLKLNNFVRGLIIT